MQKWLAPMVMICTLAIATSSRVYADDEQPFDRAALVYGKTWWCGPSGTPLCFRTAALCAKALTQKDTKCESREEAYAFSLMLMSPSKVIRLSSLVTRSTEACNKLRSETMAVGKPRVSMVSQCEKVGEKKAPPPPRLPTAKKYWCFGSSSEYYRSGCSVSKAVCELGMKKVASIGKVTFACEARTRVWAVYASMDGSAPGNDIAVTKEDCEIHRAYFSVNGEPCIQLGRKRGADDPPPAYYQEDGEEGGVPGGQAGGSEGK